MGNTRLICIDFYSDFIVRVVSQYTMSELPSVPTCNSEEIEEWLERLCRVPHFSDLYYK